VVFGVKGEGVDIDVLALIFLNKDIRVISIVFTYEVETYATISTGHVSVVLVGLDAEEVFKAAFSEAVVAVELEFGNREGSICFSRVAEGSELAGLGITITRATGTHRSLCNPDEFLAGVVKAEVRTEGGATSYGFITSELNLFDEVLVGDLGEAAAFISVKVDVVNPEADAIATKDNIITCGGKVGRSFNFEVNLDFVVLKGDQGESETGVAVEPEHEGDIKTLLGENLVSKNAGNVADHFVIADTLAFRGAEFGPDIEPFTVLTVNELATDFDFNLLDEGIAETIYWNGSSGICKFAFEPHVLDKVTVAADGSSDTASEIDVTIEGLFDGFHGKVSVATVDYLEEGNLRVASKINILGAIGDKLHKTSSHCLGDD